MTIGLLLAASAFVAETALEMKTSPVSDPAPVPAVEKTKVMLFFDTEDYTCDRSNDAIRDIANLLTEEGVRGNFNIVGFLALRLAELGRQDVIAALKPHVIGTQTLYHSRHPNIAELGDDPSYERAYRRTMADEAKGLGMLDAAFGENRCVFQCPPGNSVSAAACEVYYDLGILFSAGYGFSGPEANTSTYTHMVARPGRTTLGLWYFNQYHLPYSLWFGLESLMPAADRPCPAFGPMLDRIAEHDFMGLYMHPHMAVKKRHWDGPNYARGNNVRWREWIQVEDRDPADTKLFYERLRAFVRALKADGRIELTDVEALKAALKPRTAITAKEIPAIRAALLRDFNCIREPASWCVADVFQAAVCLLRGEAPSVPGKVYGFLSRPKGVTAPTTVSAADLKAAASRIDLGTFIPSELDVGGVRIGPADFLFAALEVLETGATSVRVVPREQLGSFKEAPGIETMRLSGSWIHPDSFKDAYVSERLRLQLWTLRIE